MNNIAEIKKTNSDCAQYTGTVTVSTYLGDRLIQKETHHNSGLNTLFAFIGDCLQGNWISAKYNRPCKLTLLTVGTEEILTETELTKATDAQKLKGISTPANNLAVDSDGYHYWSSKYAVCSPVVYDNALLVNLTTGENNQPQGEITYHFRVPFLSLVGGSTIKKLLLLPTIATDYAKNACAYFVLNNAIQVPEQSGNFTVIIDWTLTFKNSTN
jgi:hypothetical protein